ncbi:hypothetical protein JHW43_002722 [Diplocarpon mali]|nr:hypothetical protein JHW43_002722 [Diplocarpon mali]
MAPLHATPQVMPTASVAEELLAADWAWRRASLAAGYQSPSSHGNTTSFIYSAHPSIIRFPADASLYMRTHPPSSPAAQPSTAFSQPQRCGPDYLSSRSSTAPAAFRLTPPSTLQQLQQLHDRESSAEPLELASPRAVGRSIPDRSPSLLYSSPAPGPTLQIRLGHPASRRGLETGSDDAFDEAGEEAARPERGG